MDRVQDPFSLLSQPVRELLRRKGLSSLTSAQARAIPRILAGASVLLISPTGSGKTEAAVLPAFDRILAWRGDGACGVLALYVTPLRALNRDILLRLASLGGELGITVEVRHGDTPASARRQQALRPPDLLVTTPETVQAMLLGSRLRRHLASLRLVVVDEVHELAGDKRGSQLAVALERLRRLAGRPLQRVGLSATVGSPDAVASFLQGSGEPVEVVHAETAKRLAITVELPTPSEGDEELAERLLASPSLAAAVRAIEGRVRRERSVLTFVNTRQQAEFLSSRFALWEGSSETGVHHSSLSKGARIEAERAFKEGRLPNLVCTSSMELGIDVGTVDLVVQYSSPRQATRLGQRVGRAGHRADAMSRGAVVACDADDALEAAVVARRAMAGEYEATRVPQAPLDVAANQLVGLAKEGGSVDAREALRVLSAASPFRGLGAESFVPLVNLLCDLGILRRDGERLSVRRKGATYFYDTLSMIPEQRGFEVVSLHGQERIGVLDERFVVEHVEPGGVFVCQGRPWRIVGMDEERVYVERAGSCVGEIPQWEGELIPVEWEVAREVGELRGRLARSGDADALALLAGAYALDAAAAREVLSAVRASPAADERTVVVERAGRSVVVHACLGSRVNATLGLLLSSYVTLHRGHAVAMRSDPYRILLEFPDAADPELVERLLANLRPERLHEEVARMARDSSIYRWRFLHVARRFGAIARGADRSRVSFRRVVEAYEGTPVAQEALSEVLFEKLDLERAAEAAAMLGDGRLSVRRAEGGPQGSPLARPILGHAGGTVVAPERPDAEILRLLRERLRGTRLRLFCLHCAGWETSLAVRSAPEGLACQSCGARLLAVVGPDDVPLLKRFARGGAVGPSMRRRLESLRLSADLFLSHGPRALLVLAARGVGPATAARILARYHESEEELLRDVMEAERTFFRTKRFWG